MGDVTSPDNLPYPFDSDVPDIPADFQALAQATQTALLNGVTKFASATDRDGNITSPQTGMLIFLDDLQQYQGWNSDYGDWLPVAGKMPFGTVAATANVPLTGTHVKLPFTGAVARTYGGVTWSDVNAAFSGPPGMYLVQHRGIARAASGDGHVEVGMGNNVQVGSAYGGGFVGSGYEAWIGTMGFREMAEGADFATWIRAMNVNRSIGYNIFSINYQGWRHP